MPEKLGFSIAEVNNGKKFEPYLYPSEFRVTRDKEMERVASNCDGERVTIKELKNATIHVNGICSIGRHRKVDAMSQQTTKVDVISPTIKGGGMEAFIKKVEFGNMEQYMGNGPTDFLSGKYIGEYTIDLVSTGKDEYIGNAPSSSFTINP